jgi:hypothetical protein
MRFTRASGSVAGPASSSGASRLRSRSELRERNGRARAPRALLAGRVRCVFLACAAGSLLRLRPRGAERVSAGRGSRGAPGERCRRKRSASL